MKINLDDIKNLVKESVKRIVNEANKPVCHYVVDDGGYYNVFSSDMFDDNGRYIENPSYTIEDFDIIKTTTNFDIAWKMADELNRKAEAGRDDFQPGIGYYENKIYLGKIIRESTKKVLKEEYSDEEFDNMTAEDVAKLNGNYYDVTIPEWALPALVNGDYEGLSKEDEMDVTAFEKNFAPGGPCPLANGLIVGDCCIPMDGKSPSFYNSNSINRKGADCYRFALPAE